MVVMWFVKAELRPHFLPLSEADILVCTYASIQRSEVVEECGQKHLCAGLVVKYIVYGYVLYPASVQSTVCLGTVQVENVAKSRCTV